MLACPSSPIGITMFGIKPMSSSVMTGIAFMRPPIPAVTRYQRLLSRSKCNMYDWLFTSNLKLPSNRGVPIVSADAGRSPRSHLSSLKGLEPSAHCYPALRATDGAPCWAILSPSHKAGLGPASFKDLRDSNRIRKSRFVNEGRLRAPALAHR
jgi:hypothetical protein